MLAEVKLWGRTIGAISLESGQRAAAFQYTSEFARSGIQVSPNIMPLSDRVYTFPELPQATFHGLPGLLADSLPDKFGNALIDAWLSTQGRTPQSFSSVERLCYTGSRGMGALEFLPTIGPRPSRSTKIEIDRLVALASDVLSSRNAFRANFAKSPKTKGLSEILRVGTSAGGARAKAVIAWNRETNEVRSGQIEAGDGYEYWLLKFDGVTGNRDKELADPKGFGAIEYAYYLMAKQAGITMSESRLLEENERRHFMTRRFDRTSQGGKLHMQSLRALQHFDFNAAGVHSYEQALMTMRQLKLPMESLEEQFRRMLFNVVSRNQDDHVKNIAYLMNKRGEWTLAPAFDVTFSYNPTGDWTSKHQMTINNKREEFTIEDFRECAKVGLLKRGRAEKLLAQVQIAVKRWAEFAKIAGVHKEIQKQIGRHHRTAI